MDHEEQKNPMELIGMFARCPNYPKDPEALFIFAQALRQASDSIGVPMEQIVNGCAAVSQYCPTDYDLLTIAREIRDGQRREAEAKVDQVKEWRRDYGEPKTFDWHEIDLEKANRERAEYDELFKVAKLALQLNSRNPQWPSFLDLAAVLRKLGYPKTKYQRETLEAWER